MNKQLTIIATTATSIAVPARFDLRSTGLSEAQLKAIAGARPCEKTCTVTSSGVTVCCWG